MVAMISKVGTTVTSLSGSKSDAICSARVMLASRSCFTSTPRPGVPGVP